MDSTEMITNKEVGIYMGFEKKIDEIFRIFKKFQ